MISTPSIPEALAMPPSTAIVPGEIRVRSWRRVWLATSLDEIHCPDGHRIKDPLIWEHGCLRCKHREKRFAIECGKLVYLLGGGLVTPAGQSLVLLAEVTADEMKTMSRRRMAYADAIHYLGIIFRP